MVSACDKASYVKQNSMDINALCKIMKDLKPIEDSADEVIQWYCIGAVVGLAIILAISLMFWIIV